MEENKLRAPFESEDVENHWAISYGDMITLLLGFFVLFFNIKSEVMDLTLVKKDLDEYFSSKPGPVQKNVVGQQDGKVTSPFYSADISNALKMKSNMEGERILVEFPGISFFGSGNHDLTQEGKEALEDFARATNKHLGSFRLVVRGYTDATPLKIKKKYKDNLELSAFRSISAIRFLHDQGMNLSNMRIAGYGESSGSRAALDRDLASQQRKIVIVIEPLDHTEKSENKTGEAGADAKVIEEVGAVSIKGREISSVEKSSYGIIDATKQVIGATQHIVAGETKYIINATEKIIIGNSKEVIMEIKSQTEKINQVLVSNINSKLSESMMLQRAVDQTVIFELQQKGYSRHEAEEMLKNFNKKNKKVSP